MKYWIPSPGTILFLVFVIGAICGMWIEFYAYRSFMPIYP